MGKKYKRITISIPIELDKLLSHLVEESKKSRKPLTKSGVICAATDDFIQESIKILESLKSKKEEC